VGCVRGVHGVCTELRGVTTVRFPSERVKPAYKPEVTEHDAQKGVQRRAEGCTTTRRGVLEDEDHSAQHRCYIGVYLRVDPSSIQSFIFIHRKSGVTLRTISHQLLTLLTLLASERLPTQAIFPS